MPIEDAWAKLQSSGEAPVGDLLVLRLYPTSKFNLFAAIDSKSNRRLLVFKANTAPSGGLTELPEGAGFSLRLAETPGDPDGIHSLRFELINSGYSDVFDVIANDVLGIVVQAKDDSDAFMAFAGRIAEWQAFLDGLPSTGLSDQHQQGLLAELTFLNDILLKTCSAESAVGSWAGPKALAKDFQFPKFAFEVKATTTKQPTRFRFSSEIQLEAALDSRLFIVGCVYERVLSGGTRLPQVVDGIREVLKKHGLAGGRFAQRLLETGYRDVDASLYDAQFKIRARHFCEVRDAFPRIIGKDLRQGVADVQYSVLLSECLHFEVAEAEIRRLLVNQ